MTSIGEGAFSNCSNLINVTIGNSTKIGKNAFSGCNNVRKLTYADGCTTTPRTELTSIEEVDIPNSVTSIDAYAFYNCSKLSSITIPNSVTSIGLASFGRCYSISSLAIPNSVTRISGEAFSGCPGITSLELPNITRIEPNAFKDCSNLSSVTIPKSIEYIGADAFSGCPIKYLSIDSETYCKKDYFGTQIETLVIGNSVTYIDYVAFVGCFSLTSIIIPNSVTRIKSQAFAKCTSLTTVTLPNSMTSIGDNAFYYCTSLSSVIIPNGVTIIERDTFKQCYNLTSVVIPNSVTTIKESAFSRCSSLSSVIIPNSVTSIDSYAFAYCSNLSSVTIPKSIEYIGDHAFWECDNVEELIYEDGCTTAFRTGLEKMERVVIPKSVTSIANNAFSDCYYLEYFYCYAESVPKLGTDVFKTTDLKNVTLFVPNKSINDYSKAVPWRNFGAILPLPLSADGKAAVDKINAIGTVEYTDACKTLIEEARAAYDELSENDKSLITAEQLKVLTDAEAAYAELKAAAEKAAADQAAANAVVDLINAIGTVEYSDASKTLIDDARKAYDELTDDQKALVTAEQYEVLIEAENEYERLTAIITGISGSNATSSQKGGKHIHNGKIVIVKQNEHYNIEGRRIE